MRRVTRWLIISIFAFTFAQTSAGAGPIPYIVGVGEWDSGGRVSTLTMVGLNPQPEPPSRPAFAIHTSGANIVRIGITCAGRPTPNRYIATGMGSNGRWYLISIITARTIGQADRVGVTPVDVPPNPCAETSTVPLTIGKFLIG